MHCTGNHVYILTMIFFYVAYILTMIFFMLLTSFVFQEVCDSQEAWWLKRGCRRTRCMLIKKLADSFGVTVRFVQASFAKDVK